MLEVMRKMKLEQQAREQAKQAKAMQKVKAQQRKLAQQKLEMQKAKAQQRKLAQQQMNQQKAKLAQQRKEQQKEQHVQILSRRSRPVSHAHALTNGSPASGQLGSHIMKTQGEKQAIVKLESVPGIALGSVLLKGLKISVPQVQALVHSGSVRVNDHITTAGDENSLLKGTETILVATARLIKDRNKAGISAFKLAQQSTPAPGPCGPVELLCKRLRSVRRHWLITPGN